MFKADETLCGGGYAAEFSRIGGACYRLRHLPTGADVLRTPRDDDARRKTPFLYGNPILFPPNRISGGTFRFRGREYVFPVNEPETGCHLHGELYRMPMAVERGRNCVRFVFSAEEGEYLGFPHAFTLIREYGVGEFGLEERTKVINRSPLPMPFMLAYHTTFNLPFLLNGGADSCLLTLPVGKEHLRGKNYLPLMRYAEGERERLLRVGAYSPAGKAVSAFYEARGEQMRLTDASAKVSVVYTAEKRFAYRMLWSDGGGFVVVEPQTCAIDCFHLDTAPENNGLIAIPPKGEDTFFTSIRIQD